MRNKLFAALLIVSTMAGVAFAANIQGSVEPKSGGPEVWTLSVYNNSGSSMAAGAVAVWDIDNSTGDNDPWVTTTTTADTGIVAGVVYPTAIASGDSGTIAIKGVVSVTKLSGVGTSLGANVALCSSGTAGSARACASATDKSSFGFATTSATAAATTATAFINK